MDSSNQHFQTLHHTPPCVLFEDEHLLVLDKPAGMNTHAPDPYAGEGLHEWLKHREPRWARLAIVHRLDKGTSGVMVMAKSTEANRSLTEQFTQQQIKKKYLFLTDRPVPSSAQSIRSCIVRAGSKYRSFPDNYNESVAETDFQRAAPPLPPGAVPCLDPDNHKTSLTLVEAIPATGRTHQIRVHAAELGWPIYGDRSYGGSPGARIYLHAFQLELRHPVTGKRIQFQAPLPFDRDPSQALRQALIDPRETDAWRIVHGASDAWPGLYVDKLGAHLLAQSAEDLSAPQTRMLRRLIRQDRSQPASPTSNDRDSTLPSSSSGAVSLHHKQLRQDVRQTDPEEASPQCLQGSAPEGRFVIRENNVSYELSFGEGYSVGLFLDQRDNRRRLLTNHVAASFPAYPCDPRGCHVLNAFAYTCGFSVCAALAGATVTSLDLSRKYLDWGRDHFVRNGLDPNEHDFIYGDVFNWLPRLARKGRRFDVILLDPPTFSKSKQTGIFKTDKHYGQLIQQVLPMLKAGGTLFASTNTARLEPAAFMNFCRGAVVKSGRKLRRCHYVPQPPDFPVTRDEPGYLKTLWMSLG